MSFLLDLVVQETSSQQAFPTNVCAMHITSATPYNLFGWIGATWQIQHSL